MMQRLAVLMFTGLLLINIYGCVAVVAGTAGGLGTATWLSGKLSQEVNASYERTIQATESALKSMRLAVIKKTIEKNIAQIMSKYTNGKTIWIDIRPISESISKIDVRVGAINGEKEAAGKILERVKRYF